MINKERERGLSGAGEPCRRRPHGGGSRHYLASFYRGTRARRGRRRARNRNPPGGGGTAYARTYVLAIPPGHPGGEAGAPHRRRGGGRRSTGASRGASAARECAGVCVCARGGFPMGTGPTDPTTDQPSTHHVRAASFALTSPRIHVRAIARGVRRRAGRVTV